LWKIAVSCSNGSIKKFVKTTYLPCFGGKETKSSSADICEEVLPFVVNLVTVEACTAFSKEVKVQ
jgi:hypothetical protein